MEAQTIHYILALVCVGGGVLVGTPFNWVLNFLGSCVCIVLTYFLPKVHTFALHVCLLLLAAYLMGAIFAAAPDGSHLSGW